jgi:hypothetical protein
MSHATVRTLLLGLALSALSFSLFGCGGRPMAAQKLYDKGEYQAVIDKYPDLEIARRAHAKMAEALLTKGDYQGVINQYPDTPAAYKAKSELAQKLFDAGRYQTLIDSFPHSTLVVSAKERLAEALFQAGKLDSVVMLYPDSPRGKEIKNQQALEALTAAKKLRGQPRLDALQQIMGRFAGTDSYKEAADLYNQAQTAQAAKAAKKP